MLSKGMDIYVDDVTIDNKTTLTSIGSQGAINKTWRRKA